MNRTKPAAPSIPRPQAIPPGLAPDLPPGFVESQHQMTSEPYIPGTVPTKPAPGSNQG